MFALEVRLLTGRYAATQFNDRARAEWPPHPARVYSALVAALHDELEPPDDERAALEWLAEARAPEIIASSDDDVSERIQSVVYVPTNDAAALPSMDGRITALVDAERALLTSDEKARPRAEKAIAKEKAKLRDQSLKSAVDDGKGTPGNAKEVLPSGRSRQPRTFPVVVPVDDVVYLRWSEAPPPGVRHALDRVAARVARLGHSSSLVSMRVIDASVDVGERTSWAPDEFGDRLLRTVTAGQLDRLEAAHGRHGQVAPRQLPSAFVAYADVASRERETEVAESTLDDRGWLVFEVVGPPGGRRNLLDVSLAAEIARAMRGTLLAAVDGMWPPELSGHEADGSPLDRPHLAFVPLADVGFAHSTGTILGVALVPPRGLDAKARSALLEAVGRAERSASEVTSDREAPPPLRLTLGRAGELYLQRVIGESSRKTLQPKRWTQPSARWNSTTAIALDRNPGNLRAREPDIIAAAVERAEMSIADACVNLGLPPPVAVWARPRSLARGAPAARRFMPFPSNGRGPRRVCVHAEIVFDEPVRGPVILGAGRYFGLGLCAPERS